MAEIRRFIIVIQSWHASPNWDMARYDTSLIRMILVDHENTGEL
jgi:phosphate starvation-inducible membrane PsiE